MSDPFISIIMATRNAEHFLPRALASLSSQTFQDFELVAQDARSTDGTLTLLRRYARPCSLRSEADDGVYDAWNRAVERAQGEWLLFLGADDALVEPHTLERAAPLLAACPPETIFAYGQLFYGREGKIDEIYRMSLNAVFINLTCRMTLPFPATFVRAAHLRHHGGFDPSYRICGDCALVARLAAFGTIQRLPISVTYMERGGISDNPAYEARHRREFNQFLDIVRRRAPEIVDACIRTRLDTDNTFDEHDPSQDASSEE